MLSGNESISHYNRSNIFLWMTMALQAGLLNIGGFMACHQFVSHITGYATLTGFELSQQLYQQALTFFSVPVFFLIGAILSGLLVDLRLKLSRKPKYYVTFGIIFSLLLFVFICGEMDFWGPFGKPFDHDRDYFLLGALCMACGIQNGTVTSVSRSVIRTTHLTGIMTDLGIGIVRVLNRESLPNDFSNEVKANLMRLGIILSFVFGSVLGGICFSKFHYHGFFVPVVTSGILFFTTFYFQILKANRRQTFQP